MFLPDEQGLSGQDGGGGDHEGGGFVLTENLPLCLSPSPM